MPAELMNYSAVSTKVRAMYGARLAPEDYERMLSMGSLAEVASYISSSTGWRAAFDSLDPAGMRRDAMVSLLRRHYMSEYSRLFYYLDRNDRGVFRAPVALAELEQLMRFMRLAADGKASEYKSDLPEYFGRRSKINYSKLPAAETYDDMLEAVKDTGFYKSLRDLRPDDGGFPSYLSVETALRAYAFREMAAVSKTGAAAKTRLLLRESAGVQADWFNITVIDRVLTHYPELRQNILGCLLPAGAHLKPQELRRLYETDGPAEMRLALESTFYGDFVRRWPEESLERVSRRYFLRFFGRHVSSGTPSLIVPVAFFQIYEIELKNLIHVIECVRYGIPAESAMSYVITDKREQMSDNR